MSQPDKEQEQEQPLLHAVGSGNNGYGTTDGDEKRTAGFDERLDLLTKPCKAAEEAFKSAMRIAFANDEKAADAFKKALVKIYQEAIEGLNPEQAHKRLTQLQTLTAPKIIVPTRKFPFFCSSDATEKNERAINEHAEQIKMAAKTEALRSTIAPTIEDEKSAIDGYKENLDSTTLKMALEVIYKRLIETEAEHPLTLQQIKSRFKLLQDGTNASTAIGKDAAENTEIIINAIKAYAKFKALKGPIESIFDSALVQASPGENSDDDNTSSLATRYKEQHYLAAIEIFGEYIKFASVYNREHNPVLLEFWDANDQDCGVKPPQNKSCCLVM